MAVLHVPLCVCVCVCVCRSQPLCFSALPRLREWACVIVCECECVSSCYHSLSVQLLPSSSFLCRHLVYFLFCVCSWICTPVHVCAFTRFCPLFRFCVQPSLFVFLMFANVRVCVCMYVFVQVHALRLSFLFPAVAIVTRCQFLGTEANNGHQEPKGNRLGRGNTSLSPNRFMYHPHCHFIRMFVSQWVLWVFQVSPLTTRRWCEI